MENIDWGKALMDIVDALRGIEAAVDRVKDQLHDMDEWGILVYKGESNGE